MPGSPRDAGELLAALAPRLATERGKVDVATALVLPRLGYRLAGSAALRVHAQARAPHALQVLRPPGDVDVYHPARMREIAGQWQHHSYGMGVQLGETHWRTLQALRAGRPDDPVAVDFHSYLADPEHGRTKATLEVTVGGRQVGAVPLEMLGWDTIVDAEPAHTTRLSPANGLDISVEHDSPELVTSGKLWQALRLLRAGKHPDLVAKHVADLTTITAALPVDPDRLCDLFATEAATRGITPDTVLGIVAAADWAPVRAAWPSTGDVDPDAAIDNATALTHRLLAPPRAERAVRRGARRPETDPAATTHHRWRRRRHPTR